jgi:hypothetical protein
MTNIRGYEAADIYGSMGEASRCRSNTFHSNK